MTPGHTQDFVLLNIHRPGLVFPQQAGAEQIVSSNEYADAVRERERFYQAQGLHAVPAVIVNDRHLIQGGQPAEVFEKALREIAGAA